MYFSSILLFQNMYQITWLEHEYTLEKTSPISITNTLAVLLNNIWRRKLAFSCGRFLPLCQCKTLPDLARFSSLRLYFDIHLCQILPRKGKDCLTWMLSHPHSAAAADRKGQVCSSSVGAWILQCPSRPELLLQIQLRGRFPILGVAF